MPISERIEIGDRVWHWYMGTGIVVEVAPHNWKQYVTVKFPRRTHIIIRVDNCKKVDE